MVETLSYSQQGHLRLNGMLTLPPLDAALHTKSNHAEILHSFTLVKSMARQIEQVGSAYEKLKVRVQRQINNEQNKDKKNFVHVESESSGEEDEVEKKEESAHHEEWERKRKRKTKEDIEREALLMGDLYAILGLDHLTFEAGEGDIKSAYKKLALMYHPDKVGESITDKDKEIWLNVQNAYETLVDPAKRKRYDSALPFDDNIPSEQDDINDENFYETFERVFKRNALFAVKKPVPNIGEANTPMDQVYKFYKYWDNFQTWREFSQYDEYDPREAQDRYERRYMEKENKKMRDKHMKKERTRLIKLAELAYKLDPRIKAQKFKEEQEKLRLKQEIRDRKERERKEIEDKIKAEQDAKQAIIQKQQEEEKRLKEEKDLAVRRRKEAVRVLGQLCQEKLPGTKYDRFFIEEFSKKIKTADEIENLSITLRPVASSDFQDALETALEQWQQKLAQAKQQSKVDDEAKKQEEGKKDQWSIDELSKLSKAIVKYPGAILNRWKLITEFIESDKTQKQVIAKAQELAKKSSLSTAGKTIHSSTYAEKQNKEEKKVTKEQVQTPVKKTEENKVEAAVEEPAWNSEQQKQLEEGMREFPGTIAVKERWIKIAEKVEGKSAKECYERFKEICALLKKKQDGNK